MERGLQHSRTHPRHPEESSTKDLLCHSHRRCLPFVIPSAVEGSHAAFIPDSDGTGLGLTVTEGIVTQRSGTISVSN